MSDIIIYDNLDNSPGAKAKVVDSSGSGKGLVQKNKNLFSASEKNGIHVDQYGFKEKPSKDKDANKKRKKR